MELIKTLMEAMSPNLTDNQKGLLISIHSSATPQQAFETANGTMSTISAKDELIHMGLIQQSGNQLKISQLGNEALLSNNLIDEMGEITEEGTNQIEAFENNKNSQVNLESFELFKSFYQ